MCELYQLYILNGIHSPAAYTCHTSRGESIVDYMLCNKSYFQVHHINQQAYKISDHDLLYTLLPVPSAKHAATPSAGVSHPPVPSQHTPCSGILGPAAPQTLPSSPARHHTSKADTTRYKWVQGDCLAEYNQSAIHWKAHTSTSEFTTAFQEINAIHIKDNEAHTAHIEQFLISKAIKAGVLT